MNELLKSLSDEFADADFAHGYMESHSVSRIAAQIFALRKQRGWSQADLAEKSGLAQERISKIESADFDSLTMKTLHKFSRAFDVDLRIGFEPFSAGILDVVKLSPSRLEVCSRLVDLKSFHCNVTNPSIEWRSEQRTTVVQTPGRPAASALIPRDGKWQEIPDHKVAIKA